MSPRKYEAPESAATFADRIKMLIHKVGSVTEIARSCGFSEGVVRSWRDGNTDPSRARCVTLARTLGISLVWLVAGEGSMQADSANIVQISDQVSSEPAQSDRQRSKLHTAATSLQTSGMAMDSARLDTALKILQSELEIGQSQLTLAQNTDLLIELYGLLGPGGQGVVDTRAMVAFNHKLAERVRQARDTGAAA
jgi:hypothetical protein